MSMTLRSLRIAAAASLVVGAAPQLFAQATILPPAMMSVGCETVKPGMGLAHDKHEEVWARAGEAVKGGAPSIAMQSATGPNVTCWLTSVASYDQLGKNNDLYDKDAAYAKALPSLLSNDAQYVSDTRNYIAVLQPDLSAGEMPNVLTRHMTAWSEWRVRFGTEDTFIKALKAYRAAATRAGAKPEFRTYQVMNGAPSTTFWLFTSQTSMAGFDAVMATDGKTSAAFTPEDQKILDEASAKSVVSMVSNIWMYVPSQSSLTPAMRATDPFWKLKPVAKAP